MNFKSYSVLLFLSSIIYAYGQESIRSQVSIAGSVLKVDKEIVSSSYHDYYSSGMLVLIELFT